MTITGLVGALLLLALLAIIALLFWRVVQPTAAWLYYRGRTVWAVIVWAVSVIVVVVSLIYGYYIGTAASA